MKHFRAFKSVLLLFLLAQKLAEDAKIMKDQMTRRTAAKKMKMQIYTTSKNSIAAKTIANLSQTLKRLKSPPPS